MPINLCWISSEKILVVEFAVDGKIVGHTMYDISHAKLIDLIHDYLDEGKWEITVEIVS